MEDKDKTPPVQHSGPGDIVIGQKVEGDLTTSAKLRYEAACRLVSKECSENLGRLWALHEMLSTLAPEPFAHKEKRRLNETAPAYELRAQQHHRQWLQYLGQHWQSAAFREDHYKAQQISLSHKPDTASHFDAIYAELKGIDEYRQLLFYNAQQHFELSLSDDKLTQSLTSACDNWVFKYKSHYYMACLAFCRALAGWADTTDLWPWFAFYYLLKDQPQEPPTDVWMNAWLANHEQYQAWLASQIHAARPEPVRNISREITDPFIRLMRKTAGLAEILSEGEYQGIRRKDYHTPETNPQELLRLAHLSFIESDGEAAIHYLQRLLDHNPSLPDGTRAYTAQSLYRLHHPDVYGDALGIMILNVTPGLNGDVAGLIPGDVLYQIGGDALLDPAEIAIQLGRLGPATLSIQFHRPTDDTHRACVFKGGMPAGLLLSPLIIWNPYQL